MENVLVWRSAVICAYCVMSAVKLHACEGLPVHRVTSLDITLACDQQTDSQMDIQTNTHHNVYITSAFLHFFTTQRSSVAFITLHHIHLVHRMRPIATGVTRNVIFVLSVLVTQMYCEIN